MSKPQLKVLIAGAGIAGSCLAFWLSKTSLDVSITIVERSPSPRVTGQSVDMEGPAIEIIKKMKLDEAVRSRHTTEEGTAVVNSAGKALAKFPRGDSFTAEYEILRADLAGLFLEATEGLENIHYMYGDSIKALEQTEKLVNVTFAGGSTAIFDLVVAADGAASKTRPLILDEQTLQGSYNFLGQYIAFFSIPSQPADPKLWRVYNAPKGRCVMTRPHRTSTTAGAYMCITMPAHGKRDQVVESAMDKGTEETKRMLHSYFDDAGWESKRILAGMDQSDDFYMARAAQVKLPKWTNKRALVLGDAAWATFGIGTSLAIDGAYFLAGELSKIKSSGDVPEALERYEATFRPIYSKMEDLPPFFPQIAFPQTIHGIRVARFLMWLASKTKLHKLLQDGSENDWKLPEYDWVGL